MVEGGVILLNALTDSLNFTDKIVRQFIAEFLTMCVRGFKTGWIHCLGDKPEKFSGAV